MLTLSRGSAWAFATSTAFAASGWRRGSAWAFATSTAFAASGWRRVRNTEGHGQRETSRYFLCHHTSEKPFGSFDCYVDFYGYSGLVDSM
jgi:hypothetical protein